MPTSLLVPFLAAVLAFSGQDVGSILRDLPAPPGTAPRSEVRVEPADPEAGRPSRELLDFGAMETAEVSFRREAAEGQIEVALHRMAAPSGAFGVCALLRGEDPPAQDAGIGSGSYLRDEELAFWKGPFFATIHGAGTEEAKALANDLAGRIPAGRDSFPALAVLPPGNRVRNSERYLPSSRPFLGIDGLGDAWSAGYSEGARRYTLLIRKNRPPLRAEAFRSIGAVKASPTQQSPLQMIETKDGSTLLLFYVRMSPWLAVYYGPKPDSVGIVDLSEWVESLRGRKARPPAR
ncbi:MAG: hypothetical protein QUU85_19945 [Candidatus Eisenbacteria bacterium]|nr:hypothetical protein [Candidatus Eisenbacteria bacterium]